MRVSVVTPASGRRPSRFSFGLNAKIFSAPRNFGSGRKKNKAAFIYTGNEVVPKSVTRVEIHPSVTHIRHDAFAECHKLKKVVFNEGLKTIGKRVFFCTALKRIEFPSTMTEIGSISFGSCIYLKEVVLNDGLQQIGPHAFIGCSFKKIEIPPTVRRIGVSAFYNCSDLTVVTFNEGLRTIDMRAFEHCSSLESVEFPTTLEEMGRFAFRHCIKLKRILIQEGLEAIENGVFGRCFALETVQLPKSLVVTGPNSFRFCIKLKEVVLNEGLLYIGRNAFEGSALQSVEFPSTLLEFGPQSFQSSEKLKYVSLNEGLLAFGEEAFNECPLLKALSFPFVSKRWEGIGPDGRSIIRGKMSEMPAMDLSVTVGVRREAKMEEIIKSFDCFLDVLERQESKEAIAIVGLALWKTKMDEANAQDTFGCETCRIEVPGPAKDLILQYSHPEQRSNSCVSPVYNTSTVVFT